MFLVELVKAQEKPSALLLLRLLNLLLHFKNLLVFNPMQEVEIIRIIFLPFATVASLLSLLLFSVLLLLREVFQLNKVLHNRLLLFCAFEHDESELLIIVVVFGLFFDLGLELVEVGQDQTFAFVEIIRSLNTRVVLLIDLIHKRFIFLA